MEACCSEMGLSALADLTVLPVRITARAREEIRLPQYSASSLRGAFGTHLRRLVCVHPERAACAGCPMEAGWSYPYLFETPAPEGEVGTKGYEEMPRPYVLRSPSGETPLRPGEGFAWQVTLIGRAIGFLPYFVLAWQAMGQGGIGPGRGRFELVRAESLDGEGTACETLYDRADNRLNPAVRVLGLPEWTAPIQNPKHALERSEGSEIQNLDVCFLSPTRLKHAGEWAARPEFHVVWRVLQRRLSLLRRAHGAGRPEVDYAGAIRRAEAVRLERWDAREVEWERFSRRQGRRVPMRGFVGTARYAGDLAPFVPALRLGTWVGVGDNAVFGQGCYELLVEAKKGGLDANRSAPER
jgi:hypothetical protein